MILNVENLTHGFGDRAIFNNVSFRLLAGEHIGLVGANGEGKIQIRSLDWKWVQMITLPSRLIR